MTTVYVAYVYEFGHEFVEGIFSTLEKAQQRLISVLDEDDSYITDVRIESYELDNPSAEKHYCNFVYGVWEKVYND